MVVKGTESPTVERKAMELESFSRSGAQRQAFWAVGIVAGGNVRKDESVPVTEHKEFSVELHQE